VYVAAPPPVIYPAPVVVAPPPVVYAPPVVEPRVVEAPVPAIEPPSGEPRPGDRFRETRRRYHKHGDNAGLIDWVEGLLDNRLVRIYYDDYGRVEKQKWLDD
jgi:hypothetical protein